MTSAAVAELLVEETARGLQTLATYTEFQSHADQVKDALLAFLSTQKQAGKNVVAYGAAAKGNTLLNYAGVRPDLLPLVCDAAPAKQGKLMPGSHIPIASPEMLRELEPDIVLVLPWNIVEEVADQHSYVRKWGGRFAIAVPELRII